MNGGRVALAGGQQSAHGRSQWARTAFVSGQPRSAPRATGCALIRQFADSFTPFCRILLLEPCVPFKHKSVFGRCRIWHSSCLFYRNKYLTSCSTIFPKAVVFWREFLRVTYKCMCYWAHSQQFGLFQIASLLCVFFGPIVHSVGLLCRELSRFTLFGGCNAMPSVGSCCCWRPLGPNWISRGN